MSYISQRESAFDKYISGRLYPCAGNGYSTISNTAVGAIDLIYFVPFFLEKPMSFTNGAVWVNTGGAGSSVKGGIWANSTVSQRPLGAPLYKDDTGAATTSSSAAATLAFGAGTLQPFTIYWAGTKYTGTLPTMRSIPNTDLGSLSRFAGLTQLNQTHITFADTYSNNNPTIAEGASFSAGTNTCPIVYLTAT